MALQKPGLDDGPGAGTPHPASVGASLLRAAFRRRASRHRGASGSQRHRWRPSRASSLLHVHVGRRAVACKSRRIFGGQKQNPYLHTQIGVSEFNLDDDLLSHGETPHYHRRCIVSLLSSGWDQVVPMLYGRQEIRVLSRDLMASLQQIGYVIDLCVAGELSVHCVFTHRNLVLFRFSA